MKRSVVFALMCTAILVLSFGTSHSQLVPRLVLIEEGTNTGCPPCASLNPGVEQFLLAHVGNIVHIAYHPNWPNASDPLYLNDQSDNQYRVATYYGITGVPNVTIDGEAPYIPSSPDLLEAHFLPRLSKLSPLAMTVNRTVNGSTVSVVVTIRAVGDISSYSRLYLRVAAVENSYDHPGPNGEKSYIHPVRAMMPTYTGTALKLKLGDSVSYTLTYPLKAAYIAANMYEVAFVQSDASKEVLQTATSQALPLQLMPHPGTALVQRASSATQSSFDLTNATKAAADYTVEFVPTSPDVWPMTINGNPALAPSTIHVEAGAAMPLALAVQQGTGLWCAGNVVVTTSDGKSSASYPVKFIAPAANVAFVDPGGDTSTSKYTVGSLKNLGEQFVPMSSADMTMFGGWKTSEFPDVVIGAGKWIISGGDKANVANYMKTGGRLFLHGGEIAFGLADPNATATDIDKPFLSNTLHATYVRDVDGEHFVTGNQYDEVGMKFTAHLDMDSGTVEANQPDLIAPANGAQSIFYYGGDNSQTAGIRWNDATGKGIYCAFGLENLNTTDRDAVIREGLAWLRSAPSQLAVPGQPFQSNQLYAYPNPTSSFATIPFSLTDPADVRLSVYDSRGSEVATLVSGPTTSGQHLVTLDASQFASGTYFVVLRTSNGMERRAITIEH